VHVFWLRQPDPGPVHPACRSGPGVARVLSQVRRLRTDARGDANLLRARRKDLLQDGLPEVGRRGAHSAACICLHHMQPDTSNVFRHFPIRFCRRAGMLAEPLYDIKKWSEGGGVHPFYLPVANWQTWVVYCNNTIVIVVFDNELTLLINYNLFK